MVRGKECLRSNCLHEIFLKFSLFAHIFIFFTFSHSWLFSLSRLSTVQHHLRFAKTKQTTDCEQNKQTKQSSGQVTAKNPEENKQTKQCKRLTTTQFQVHSSPNVSRSRSRSRACGPSQVDYLLCLGKCQTRVNRQLFRSLRKNSTGTLMRQSKLLVSGTVPTSVIIQTIRLYGRSFSSTWKHIIF